MDIENTIIACAADAYGVDSADISTNTNIRNELSNQSIKMIIFISAIEDALNVKIEIREAGSLITIGDFIAKVKGLV